MELTRQIRWSVILGALFILANAVALYFEQYYFMALPLGLLVIWAALFRLDKLLLFVVMCTPVSLNLEQLEIGGVGFYLPTEPLLFGILLLMVFRIMQGQSIDSRIWKHPLSYIIYAYVGWIAFTTVSSEYPVVSLKFLLAKLWFIVPMYFVAAHIFSNLRNIRQYQLLYIFPLLLVIIYTVIRHSTFGFDKDAGHWVMEPFYKDHTSYGAVLAMYFPVIVGLTIRKKLSPFVRTILVIGTIILAIGVVFSYTRAAWVSLAAAMVLMVAMMLKIRFRTILFSFIALAAFVWSTQDQLLIVMEKNKQDSSDNLAEHVESISNVSSDASNLERLNRWNCALEMFYERPITGWGPGTYQFVYAPFQRFEDLTIISTNNADGGNAHSEYLGPLAEQGIPGSLIVLVLVLYTCFFSFRLYHEVHDREIKILVMTTFMGLFTYFVHGTLNNYLDTDKASIPFWGFLAVLVAVDIFHKKNRAEAATQAVSK
ncbi:MAG: O-antigen ligase family protein [Flavobacteriales bacterium]|nr:O-antigen ligase family protein [Flavobacteriales bacterium]